MKKTALKQVNHNKRPIYKFREIDKNENGQYIEAASKSGHEAVTGSSDPDFSAKLFNDFCHANGRTVSALNAAAAAMAGIAPKDEIEGMLAAQIVTAHNHTLRAFALASKSDRIDIQERFSNLGLKLSRCFVNLVEALNKNRGKGHQKVEVKHVYVNKGANAVIGDVTTTKGGGE